MGQQTNKIQKRRRRLAYLERKKLKAKQAAVAPAKPKARRAAPKKKEAAPAPAPVADTPAVPTPERKPRRPRRRLPLQRSNGSTHEGVSVPHGARFPKHADGRKEGNTFNLPALPISCAVLRP
jgi:hypothetical protein